ncbi:hypothetical protein FHX48_000539 [Microbacterium halimionae]|uniref:Uncharacterized protein n=1 Tax=Microbacterium halimionae TaxID=1526413 RepID=A0A7W3PL24_9MICO|nr:hypothetical protein [Microbacterium halimionae]NII95534.1 hypothetical protein [Microbacterium halimionae]
MASDDRGSVLYVEDDADIATMTVTAHDAQHARH